jgi:hypothetical protein
MKFHSISPTLMLIAMAAVLCLTGVVASAQTWREELRAEEAKNNARIAAIISQAEPLENALRRNTAEIDRHNQNPPPEDDPAAIGAYNSEAARLNSAKHGLVAELQRLAEERDRLITRNSEIQNGLQCVARPKACTSDADCNACSTCATFDGRGKTGYCQPRP